MAEMCLSKTTTKTQFSSLLISDFFLFISFIFSHPLYFLYFIFFSPYLLKVLSFLSPLFITTSLLLIALLTVSPGLFHGSASPESSENKVSFLLTAYHKIVEGLKCKVTDQNEDDHFDCIKELEAYKIVFDTSMFDVFEFRAAENFLEDFDESSINCSSHDDYSTIEEKQIDIVHVKTTLPAMEDKRLEELFREFDTFDQIKCNVEEKNIEACGVESDKVVEEDHKKVKSLRSRSEATGNKQSDPTIKESRELGANAINSTYSVGEYDGSRELEYNLGSYGSMRKEKEWKRTLACKLFEERHNVDGGSEGMDSLWETYETDLSKGKSKRKNKKKGDRERYEEDEGEEEDLDEQLCCLQALKFSAGKMNLGMGRPNLMKFSKAFKGIGWLHRVTSHDKKVHHGDRF